MYVTGGQRKEDSTFELDPKSVKVDDRRILSYIVLVRVIMCCGAEQKKHPMRPMSTKFETTTGHGEVTHCQGSSRGKRKKHIN